MELALLSPHTAANHGDERIKKEVVAALHKLIQRKARAVNVLVNDGAIQLEGTLGRYYDKQLAQEAVRQLPNVRTIINNIKVVN
jgi:osmotically-inducible protein OsmY